MEKQTRSALGLVFLTVFLDIIGFSIVFPLYPRMLEYYVALEGEGSFVAQLVQSLAEFSGTGPGAEFAVVTLFGSVLGSLYSMLQFLFAPLWGSLSDRMGRRPVLLVTISGIALSYVVWFFSGSFVVLVISRTIGGIMAGNISTASAVVADTCSDRDRAKGMGILGAGIGLGFVLGPALGGMASLIDFTEIWPGGVRFGVNPFSSAALIALLLALVNLITIARRLGETHPPEKRGTSDEARSINVFRQLKRLSYPGVPRTNLIFYLYLVAFSAIEFTLTFLATERFDFGPGDNAWMFVFVGLLIALVQGGFVRRVAPKYGEKRVAIAGMILIVPGFVLVGLAQGMGALYGGLAFMAVGSALTMPCLSALISLYTPSDRQGLSLGTFRSMGALSRATGPIFGGLLYWKFGSTTPYIAGAVLLLLPIVLSFALPEPKHEDAPEVT